MKEIEEVGDLSKYSKEELLSLGEQYLKIRNEDLGLAFIYQAAERGNRKAGSVLFALAEKYYQKGEYGIARHAFRLLSEMGDGKSSLYLGKMAEQESGRYSSVKNAFEYYATAFQQGVPMGALLAGRLMTSDALRDAEVRDIAISWYEEAISQGINEGYAEIGRLYLDRGRDEKPGHPPKDDRRALSWFLKGALRGDALSKELAGDCFIQGKGTKMDVQRGLTLYNQAFHDGSVSVCFKLGDLYLKGDKVHSNIDLAIAWYLKAFERGDKRGRFEAGRVSYLAALTALKYQKTEDREKALHYLKQAISFGYDEAYAEMAALAKKEGNEKGYVGFLKQGMKAGNEACRRKWIAYSKDKAAACTGRIEEINGPGIKNHFSEEEEQALKEGVLWYKRAANAGDVDSWAILARFYFFYGKLLGVKDKDFIRAAKNGYTADIGNTRRLLWLYYAGNRPYAEGVMHKEDPKQAFLLARQLASEGFKDFYRTLAFYYQTGYGTKRSTRMARLWIERAGDY